MPARQTCPASSYWPAALAAAASRSASANTSSGPLPPSSPVKGTMFSAAARPMWRAVSGEPVNETRRTPGCETRAAPASSPMPCTTLKTPGGKPASTVRSASSEPDSGDHSAGLRMTVQPAARPGARFQVESMNGAFQGVMTAAGPPACAARGSGCRSTPTRAPRRPRRGRRRRGSCAPRGRSRAPSASAAASPCPRTRRRRGARRSRRSGRRGGAGARRGPRARARPRRGTRRARPARRGRPRAGRRARPPPSGRSSMGERSRKWSADATRSPPMKWSTETRTPATSTPVASTATITLTARSPSPGRRRCRRR